MISIQREREGAPLIGLPFAACNEAGVSAAFSGGIGQRIGPIGSSSGVNREARSCDARPSLNLRFSVRHAATFATVRDDRA